MKKPVACLLIMLLMITLNCYADANEVPARTVILVTEYQQMGWSETFQFGALDTEGNLWFYEDEVRGDVPYSHEELVLWAETTELLTLTDTIPAEDLAAIRGLIDALEMKTPVYVNASNDAGCQSSMAIRADGEIVVLGASGDSFYESADPSARSLYAMARRLFPEVRAFDERPTAAADSSQGNDLLSFCGYGRMDLTKLTMTAFFNDCEAGAYEIEPALTAADLMAMTVTGKQNSLHTTGNTVSYYFTDADGKTAAVFEFYNDLLVQPDGMYKVQ